MDRLTKLIELRAKALGEIDAIKEERKAITDLVEAEGRDDLTAEEDVKFRGLVADVKAKQVVVDDLSEQIRDLEAENERAGRNSEEARAVAKAVVTEVKEPRIYVEGNGNSYFRDLMRVKRDRDHDGASAERLRRHAVDVSTAPEYRAAMSRIDGQGGYFTPPAWLMSQYVELARAGRAYANLTTQQALPGGTDSLNIPKILTGTSTGIQTADNQNITASSATDTSVSAPVQTIAGYQDIALQSLDQSPLNFDEVLFRDLIADYATQVDKQVIFGSGTSGQVVGVRSTAGIETVTADTATVTSLYAKLADAVQRIHSLRFAPPTVIVMHPRRWAYFLAAVDNAGRPLVTPQGPGQNAIATLGAVAAEQVVGYMHGLPVVTDPSMPTTVNTTQDVIHVLRASDLWLFESPLRTRVLDEIGSQSLTVRLQVHGYVAFTAGRQPKSVVELTGSGLVAPTFA